MTVSEVDTVTETDHREFGAALGYIYRLDYRIRFLSTQDLTI